MASEIKYLYEQEIAELYAQLDMDTSKYAARNRAIFYIAKYCGLRASEIGLLKIQDFHICSREIYCRRLKGSQNNTIRIIDPKVINILEEYLSFLSAFCISDFLFPSQFNRPISRKTLDYLMKHYCSGTSIPADKQHFHVLKHTRAIELANRGIRMEDIQWWLGHQSIKNTQIYAQFTTAQQEALYRKLLEENNGKP